MQKIVNNLVLNKLQIRLGLDVFAAFKLLAKTLDSLLLVPYGPRASTYEFVTESDGIHT